VTKKFEKIHKNLYFEIVFAAHKNLLQKLFDIKRKNT